MDDRKIKELLDLWESVAVDLNRVIAERGYIEINNRALWQRYLHQWDNQTWADLLELICTLHQHTVAAALNPGQRRAVESAISALLKRGSHTPRVLDTAPYKPVAWQCLMLLREQWNQIQGRNIPNRVPAG